MFNSHTYIDTVKVEKANAIARYQRFRNLAKLLQLLKLVMLLAILSWSSKHIPDAVEITSKYVVQLSLYVLNPHVIFLIGNAIVLALYVLSRHIDVGNSSATSDFYEDYEKRENRLSVDAVESPQLETALPILISEEEEEQIVCKENSNVSSETESEVVEKARCIQKFERTVSEKWEPARAKKELRRSETEVRRVVVSRIDRVDSLSNEDFRLTVEAFIEKQQKFLRQQRMSEIE